MQENRKAKGTAGGIPVFCAYDKIVELSELRPNPKNPNQHPEEQVALLAKIIEVQGWRAPVTVSTLSGYIVRGHGRFLAAKLIGCPVPVDYQDYKSEDEELADLVADNRLAELSEIDNKLLADVFAGLQDIDVSLTGYTRDEVDEINAALEESLMADIDDVKSKPEVKLHKLKFDSTEIPMTDTEYDRLKEMLDDYVDENGVVFGFVGWLIDDRNSED